MIKRLKFDLEELVDRMINQLPKEVFESDSTTFLDPSMAGGQFVTAVEDKLRKYGHSDSNISKRVFGLIENKLRLNYIMNTHKLVGSYNVGDFLKKDFNNMKFDVIIGNPPYNSSSGGKKLWPLFSTHSSTLLKENGCILFVTPNTWLYRPHSPKMKEMVSTCKQQELILIDTTVSKYFPNIGEDIGYWMLKNSNRETNTKLILQDEEKYIQYVGQVIAMNRSDELKNSITGKIRLQESQKWHHRDYTMSHNIHIENGELSEVKNNIFSIPVLQTASKVLYGKPEDITNSWKLIINNSGYYSSKKELDKYQKVTDSFGVGLGTYGLLVKSKSEALNARSFFNSKAYRFVIEENKTSGFNTEVKYLPLLDVRKSWNDQEIYEYFNLTQEEIDLIESAVA
jgi:hypothetical protein